MYRPVLVTAPTTTPVTLTEVKAQLDISYTEKDTYLNGLIAAAVSHLDGWSGILGLCLESQTWRQDFDVFARCLRLPLFPVIEIDEITYLDAAGDEQIVSESDYSLLEDAIGAYVRFKDSFAFPSVYAEGPAVSITYSAGHAQAESVSTVDAAIKQAILLLIRHWFDNPGAVVVGVSAQKLPFAVDALLAPKRRIRF